MMERRERRVCSGSLAMSMPSMMMRPAWRQRHGGGGGTKEWGGGTKEWGELVVPGTGSAWERGSHEDAGGGSDCWASYDI